MGGDIRRIENWKKNVRTMAILIILSALWTYPIISFMILRRTKKLPDIRKRLIRISCILSGLAFFGLATNISTTFSELDWFIVSTVYLTICCALMWTQFQKNRVLKILGIVLMLLFFGVGYFSGTVGILGVGFVVGDYDTDYEKWLGDGVIYKETNIGNALSDERGKKVEIYETITWLPLIEWRKQLKVYDEYVPIITTPLNVNYNADKEEIYLSASAKIHEKYIKWGDTLVINKIK